MKYNIYCDESCHLEHDGSKKMFISAIICPEREVAEINREIRELKHASGIMPEMKWVKLSSSKRDAYMNLVEFFFKKPTMRFRILVVDNKDQYDPMYNESYDEWYYKMYFDMLSPIINTRNEYNIYLDKKDTKTKTRVSKLKKILRHKKQDYKGQIIRRIQVIQSHDVEIMQLVDILMGAVAYEQRGLHTVAVKNEIINLIKERLHLETFDDSSTFREMKFNIFHLQLRENHEI